VGIDHESSTPLYVQLAASSDVTGEDIPEWWPYAAEFPHWHVWRGVCGLVYARRLRV
jgi:hypothetical protein